jgi:hypothetical protein
LQRSRRRCRKARTSSPQSIPVMSIGRALSPPPSASILVSNHRHRRQNKNRDDAHVIPTGLTLTSSEYNAASRTNLFWMQHFHSTLPTIHAESVRCNTRALTRLWIVDCHDDEIKATSRCCCKCGGEGVVGMCRPQSHPGRSHRACQPSDLPDAAVARASAAVRREVHLRGIVRQQRGRRRSAPVLVSSHTRVTNAHRASHMQPKGRLTQLSSTAARSSPPDYRQTGCLAGLRRLVAMPAPIASESDPSRSHSR